MEEPYILNTSQLVQSIGTSQLPSVSALVASGKGRNPAACLCIPHSGISFFDLSDQTPLSSLTLGPSFAPSTRPASRSVPATAAPSARIKSTRRTYVGTGNTVTCWTELERKDGSVDGEAVKAVFERTKAVASILAPKSLPDHLLVLSSDGQLELVSETDFATLASLPSTSKAPLVTLEAFPIRTGFLSNLVTSTDSHAHVVYTIQYQALANEANGKSKKGKRPSALDVMSDVNVVDQDYHVTIHVALVDPAVEIEGAKVAKIQPFGQVALDAKQVVVSEDGYLTALTSAGTLEAYRLDSVIEATSYADLFNADTTTEIRLSLINSYSLSSSALVVPSTTILALHSSFIILASLKPASIKTSSSLSVPTSEPSTLVLLTFDIRLGSFISEQVVPVPGAVLPPSSSPSKLVLSLDTISKQMAALNICPTTNTGRSATFILPLSLPSASVLAAVVGKYPLTLRYLSQGQKEETNEKMNKRSGVSKAKADLLEASEKARRELLEAIRDVAPTEADALFVSFVEEEEKRLKEYRLEKARLAQEKEEARRKAVRENKEIQNEAAETGGKKWKLAERKIEEAIKKAHGKHWTQVTESRIKGVSDIFRYRYYEERKAKEESQGEIVKEEKAAPVEESVEVELPSSFVTLLMRHYFATPLESGNPIDSTTADVDPHPVGLVRYLLSRSAVGDGVVEGGLIRHLARSGDWANVGLALESLDDVPESSTVALLKQVIKHHASKDVESMEVDTPSTTLPQSIPPLKTFLRSFLASPCTPATLRQEVQRQLTADEVVVVLHVLDQWLKWWINNNEVAGGEANGHENGETGKKTRLRRDPFAVVESRGKEVPSVSSVVNLVQALLDAHFVSLLLLRQSHGLLRRLQRHIAIHMTRTTDLTSLLGALSIYSHAKTTEKALAQQSKDKTPFEARMASRVSAQEKHNQVAQYSVDKFYL